MALSRPATQQRNVFRHAEITGITSTTLFTSGGLMTMCMHCVPVTEKRRPWGDARRTAYHLSVVPGPQPRDAETRTTGSRMSVEVKLRRAEGERGTKRRPGSPPVSSNARHGLCLSCRPSQQIRAFMRITLGPHATAAADATGAAPIKDSAASGTAKSGCGGEGAGQICSAPFTLRDHHCELLSPFGGLCLHAVQRAVRPPDRNPHATRGMAVRSAWPGQDWWLAAPARLLEWGCFSGNRRRERGTAVDEKTGS